MTIEADDVKGDVTHAHKIVSSAIIVVPPQDFAHPSY
jgi:hypothetical protein